MSNKIEAGHSYCNPDSPSVTPARLKNFAACKQAFPALAAEYAAKEQRFIYGDCNEFKGDDCSHNHLWFDRMNTGKINPRLTPAEAAFFESLPVNNPPRPRKEVRK